MRHHHRQACNALSLKQCGALKPDGTRWRAGGEVKGKLANGVGSKYSHTTSNVVYPALLTLMRTPRLLAVDWTDSPADLNGLVRFGERWNLVSARVPSGFKRALLHQIKEGKGMRIYYYRQQIWLGGSTSLGVPIHLTNQTNQPTNDMQQSPSWETNGCSASQKSPALYGTRRISTAFIPARHPSLFWASLIQPMPPFHFLRFTLNYSLIYTWVSQVVSFHQVSPPKPSMHHSYPPYVLRAPPS